MARGRKRQPKRADNRLLAKAKRLSKAFHGTDADVYELAPAERRPLPRYVVKVGNVEDVTYQPDSDSKRADSQWRHKSGDRGFAQRSGKHKPMLAVDPRTRKPIWVPNRSGMKLTKRGLVG